MNVNYGFKETRLYKNFRDDVVEHLKNKLKEGHVLLSGTNATLFGNGPEMLLALSGEFDLNAKYNESLVLSRGEIACFRFEHGRKLACARSPHITMGNLYYAVNNVRNDIWNYFDLGDNIVCVNAIEENIQQRLNGCDYDSDTMLITDDQFIANELAKQDGRFSVPVCSIKSSYNHNQTLADLDYATSKNRIGRIVNLSQKLNSVLWDNLNSDSPNIEEAEKTYLDICILAVLSGIEIDKAKRAYENVNVFAELERIVKIYGKDKPNFFKAIKNSEIERRINAEEDLEKREELRLELEKNYKVYNTAMEYVYKIASAVDFRSGKKRRARYMRIIEMIKSPSRDYNSSVYGQRDTIIELNEEYKNTLNGLYKTLKLAASDEKEIIYSKIVETKNERNNVINGLLCNEYLLYLVLKHYDVGKGQNWRLYAPIRESDLFIRMLKNSDETLKIVSPSVNGEIVLYGQNYTKI